MRTTLESKAGVDDASGISRFTAPDLEGITNGKIVNIDLTDRCDIHCQGCFTAEGRQAEQDLQKLGVEPQLLTIHEIETIVQQVRKAGFTTILTTGQGEPTIHRRRFWDFVDVVRDNAMIPAVTTHGLWAEEKDADALYQKGVTVISKLWSPHEQMNKALLGDRQNRPYVDFRDICLPLGVSHLIERYTDPDSILQNGYRLALNTMINAHNANDLIRLLEWYRENKILPYFEFIFASGFARKNPELWLDGQAGETLYQEPYTELHLRKAIAHRVVQRDAELGFTYPVDINPTGKVGQNVFDNSRTLMINPYGYVAGCPAMGTYMAGANGLLNVRDHLAEILERGYGKKELNPCTVGGYSCGADAYDRKNRSNARGHE